MSSARGQPAAFGRETRASSLIARREVALVGGLIVVAAVVRFAALGAQSLWYDEAVTSQLVRASFGHMLDGVGRESTPPLYYVLAWGWTRLFGHGEAGLRSLSAVAGALLVPVAYLAARQLVGRRPAMAVGALAALSPTLVWYSQEARAYGLMTLACASSIMLFARAIDRPDGRRLAAWAAVSTLAIATHYFALLLVVAEAVWLLLRASRRRAVAMAVAAVAVACLPLVALALHQRTVGGSAWIERVPLGERLGDGLAFFAAGPGLRSLTSPEVLLAFLAAVVVAAAVALLLGTRTSPARRGALVALGLAATVVGLPILATAGGIDYVLDRNLLPAWLPLAIVVAAALTSPRAGFTGPMVLAGALGLFAVVDLRVPARAALQRDDWRAVSRALGPPRPGRIVEVAPGYQATGLATYRPALTSMTSPLSVDEVDTVVMLKGPARWVSTGREAAPPAAFRRISAQTVQGRIAVTRYRAAHPAVVNPASLVGAGVHGTNFAAALVEASR